MSMYMYNLSIHMYIHARHACGMAVLDSLCVCVLGLGFVCVCVCVCVCFAGVGWGLNGCCLLNGIMMIHNAPMPLCSCLIELYACTPR